MNHDRRLSGIWLPLITPFREGALDEPSLRRLVRHYRAAPVDGLIVAATTGEGLTLDDAETERVVAAVAAELEGAKPLYLGLCGSDTRRLVARPRMTAEWPIAGYLIACPYYSRPSQAGLALHFTALADAAAHPIVVYNIPYRTGVNLANDTLLTLAAHPKIAGVKDCCADPAQSFDLLRRRRAGFAVLTGEDAFFHGALAQGADGGILASAHIDPAAFAAVRTAYLRGDHEEALERWRALVDVVRLIFAEPNPAPIKHWLWRAGLITSPELRLPMTGISPDLANRLDRLIESRPAAA
ncbi:MAG TPA: 4-hydroxy-tetrahydrodipicolinate synthase [Stellaceae bacterium]|nr:4-hydroxy-tetrahydrodipicolinate synthase [Stellaceae bacterium]